MLGSIRRFNAWFITAMGLGAFLFGNVWFGALSLVVGLLLLSRAYRIAAIFGVRLAWVRAEGPITLAGERLRLSLPGGDVIVLVDPNMLARSGEDPRRNVVRLDGGGAVVWQVEAPSADLERPPFFHLELDDAGRLSGRSTDGAEHLIDPASGRVSSGPDAGAQGQPIKAPPPP